MVVCDSSTLIHLAAIGRLSLLHELYRMLTVPLAVWKEVVEQGKGRPGVAEVAAARRDGWIEVRSATNEPLIRSLRQDLDEGESEALALAVEHGADLVLLDEAEARRMADVFGLRKTGAIGVLLRAKVEGKIPLLQPELERLRNEAGFWIEEKLYRQVLEATGEGQRKKPP